MDTVAGIFRNLQVRHIFCVHRPDAVKVLDQTIHIPLSSSYPLSPSPAQCGEDKVVGFSDETSSLVPEVITEESPPLLHAPSLGPPVRTPAARRANSSAVQAEEILPHEEKLFIPKLPLFFPVIRDVDSWVRKVFLAGHLSQRFLRGRNYHLIRTRQPNIKFMTSRQISVYEGVTCLRCGAIFFVDLMSHQTPLSGLILNRLILEQTTVRLLPPADPSKASTASPVEK